MKIILFATGSFAVPTLERLALSKAHALTCVTQPDRPQGRGLRQLPSPVKARATELGIAVAEPDDLAAWVAAAPSPRPDVGIVVDYGRLLPRELLAWPAHGCIGIHPSLLPKYRGAGPVAWAILSGDARTGITVYQLTERLDDGAILAQREEAIQPRDTTATLSGRLAALGAEMVEEVAASLSRGEPAPRPQAAAGSSYAPKLTKAFGQITWDQPAAAIDRLIRGTIPWPGAWTSWQGQPLRVWSAQPEPERAAEQAPGTVVSAAAEGIRVATSEGTLVIQQLQLAGRRHMTAEAFLAGHQLCAGDILGMGQGARGKGQGT